MSRSVLFPLVLVSVALLAEAGLATTPDQCRRQCDRYTRQIEELQDQMELLTQSASITRQMEALLEEQRQCLAECDALESAQETFRICVSNAQGDETLLEYCRQDYRRDRP